VVGVTVFRERLDVVEPIFRIDLGLDSSFTDFSTVVSGAYRYTVQTRNRFGRSERRRVRRGVSFGGNGVRLERVELGLLGERLGGVGPLAAGPLDRAPRLFVPEGRPLGPAMIRSKRQSIMPARPETALT
jgi:hypothetical protein